MNNPKNEIATMKTTHTNHILSGLVFLSIFIFQFAFTSCGSEAHYETDGVVVRMTIRNISAGFVECDFSTNKDAYYLIALCEPWEDYNPVANSKQFMQLALDSAYAEYLLWRNGLRRDKEFNVAPFSSHSLQYGEISHFFTGLIPDNDYWVFCFPVDPETMKPVGKLLLENIHTPLESTVDIRFGYRVRDVWDYIYPIDTTGQINARYPYIATTIDSAVIAQDTLDYSGDPMIYFLNWEIHAFLYPDLITPYYGVKVIHNDGIQSSLVFEEGHTYYTGITGFDGLFKRMTVFKFKWTKGCEYYFHDTDSTNLFILNYPDIYQ